MDADSYPQEILADEEPKYLKRQKPVEIRRRKSGKKPWKTYLRVLFGVSCACLMATTVYAASRYLRTSPALELLHADQIAIHGNNRVTHSALLGIFAVDRGRSVLRIPLEARRKQIESFAWVERVSVRRDLPNRLNVEVQERVPIAFLRDDDDLALIDIHGVSLPRPQAGDFHFPVITGIHTGLPADERERRMQMFSGFLSQIDSVRAGASQQVSEIDLSDGHNLIATFSDLPGTVASSSWNTSDGPLVVDFGDRAFQQRFGTLLDQIGQWRATVGRVGSVDLRFNGQVIVNPSLDTAPPKVSPALAPVEAVSAPLAAPAAPASKPLALKAKSQKESPPLATRQTQKKHAAKKTKSAAATATSKNKKKDSKRQGNKSKQAE